MFRPDDPWRVVDLSSLWAGPLAARVLAEAGAAVTKLESVTRPDGARATPAFYRWLHPPAETVLQVDFATVAGRQAAADLVNNADVVIEASRPRALEQLGLGPDDRPDRPGRVWLSITGHGREVPGRDWIAFGDDAAVAGGLVALDADGNPVFCGDAIADPLTGLTGALAVLEARTRGGGYLIDLAMSRAAAAAGPGSGRPGGPGSGGPGVPGFEGPGAPGSGGPGVVEPDGSGGWVVQTGSRREAVRERPEHLALIGPARR
jgi:crotonobetainyl-CoA:carnitine CoA-transferase CaiB-like acyl-CoA transferase